MAPRCRCGATDDLICPEDNGIRMRALCERCMLLNLDERDEELHRLWWDRGPTNGEESPESARHREQVVEWLNRISG